MKAKLLLMTAFAMMAATAEATVPKKVGERVPVSVVFNGQTIQFTPLKFEEAREKQNVGYGDGWSRYKKVASTYCASGEVEHLFDSSRFQLQAQKQCNEAIQERLNDPKMKPIIEGDLAEYFATCLSGFGFGYYEQLGKLLSDPVCQKKLGDTYGKQEAASDAWIYCKQATPYNKEESAAQACTPGNIHGGTDSFSIGADTVVLNYPVMGKYIVACQKSYLVAFEKALVELKCKRGGRAKSDEDLRSAKIVPTTRVPPRTSEAKSPKTKRPAQ